VLLDSKRITANIANCREAAHERFLASQQTGNCDFGHVSGRERTDGDVRVVGMPVHVDQTWYQRSATTVDHPAACDSKWFGRNCGDQVAGHHHVGVFNQRFVHAVKHVDVCE
jgi:hypothetical protein